MKMPDLKPEKHPEIYNHFREFEPNKLIQNLSFKTAGLALPAVLYSEGYAYETVGEHLKTGNSILWSVNHTSNSDSLTLASVANRYPLLRPLKGNTTIPGKVPLFQHPLIGRIIPHVPAHPVFRKLDFIFEGQEDKGLREEAAEAVIQFNINHINDGGSVAMHPEGGGNTENPRVVQALRLGIGSIATRVADPSRLLVVDTAIAYRTHIGPARLRPLVVVGEPYCPEGMTVNDVVEKSHAHLQSLVTIAFDLVKVA